DRECIGSATHLDSYLSMGIPNSIASAVEVLCCKNHECVMCACFQILCQFKNVEMLLKL
ncbi:hypothetical protein MKX03_006419, partial [Papaver bracteatum]